MIGDFTAGRLDGPVVNVDRNGKRVNWHFSQDGIDVQQDAHLVAGDPIEMSPGQFRRLYDTCLIRYKITNMDSKKHDVGFRFLLDTFIGDNDGTPFTVPGSPNLVKSHQDYRDDKVPDFFQALEKGPISRTPAPIDAHLNVKIGDPYEPPTRVSLTRFIPGRDKTHDVRRSAPRIQRRFGGRSLLEVGAARARQVARDRLRLRGRQRGRQRGIDDPESRTDPRRRLLLARRSPLQARRQGENPRRSANCRKGCSSSTRRRQTQPLAIVGDGKQPSPATWRIRAIKMGPFQISVTSRSIQRDPLRDGVPVEHFLTWRQV